MLHMWKEKATNSQNVIEILVAEVGVVSVNQLRIQIKRVVNRMITQTRHSMRF